MKTLYIPLCVFIIIGTFGLSWAVHMTPIETDTEEIHYLQQDGLEAKCLFIQRGNQSGISCDWAHAKPMHADDPGI